MIAYPSIVKNYVSYFDTPSKKNYVWLALSLVTLIILVVLIYPAILYIFDLGSQLTKTRQIDKALTEKITALKTAQATIDNYNNDFDLIDRVLPSGTQVAEYLQSLEKTIAASQANVLGIQFDETSLTAVQNSINSTLVPVTFTISLTGNFDNLKAALAALEKSQRVTDITSTSFSNNVDDTAGLKLTIKAQTYFYGIKDTTTIVK